jgi:thiamine-monophosphate kinase
MQLVVAMDTLNSGVHFPPETAPADIGWKALAVNLSDLAAMGATPAWCTPVAVLPAPDAPWLDAFLDGFLRAGRQQHLVAPDRRRHHARSALDLRHGASDVVPCGTALRRDGARDGDEVWITGTPGDAAAALAQWRVGAGVDHTLRARLDRPSPRLAARARPAWPRDACIDVSDGLLADLGHILRASGVGASIEAASVAGLAGAGGGISRCDAARLRQLTGGDDYELCFTASPEQGAAILAALAACNTTATRIGRIETVPGLRVVTPQGAAWSGTPAGWDHFARATP